MPLTDIHIGPFAAIYIGDAASSMQVLEQLSSIPTDVQRVSYNVTQQFEYVINSSVQNGPATVTANLRFLSDDSNVIKIANGNWIDAAYDDTPSEFKEYTLLLVHPDTEAPSSILIPICYTTKVVDLEYSKGSPTQTGIVFEYKNRNRFTPIYYKRTAQELSDILGVRSPL